MIKEGLDMDLISKVSGKSEEEILEIKKILE